MQEYARDTLVGQSIPQRESTKDLKNIGVLKSQIVEAQDTLVASKTNLI